MSMPHDDLLARIRSGLPAGPVVLATVEPSPQEAVAQWAMESGWKRGTHPTPTATVLARLCATWCDARGWCVAPTQIQVGEGLRGAGYTRVQRGGMRGYGVAEGVAATLWDMAGIAGLASRPEVRLTPRRVLSSRRPRPLMTEAKGRAVLDSTLRVYPSAAVAATLVRCAAPSISHAAHKGRPAAGFLWRFLTCEEVGGLPPETRAGDRVTALRW